MYTTSLFAVPEVVYLQGKGLISRQVSFLEAFFDLIDVANSNSNSSLDRSPTPQLNRYNVQMPCH